jgi:D-alanine-D-alanine ligase
MGLDVDCLAFSADALYTALREGSPDLVFSLVESVRAGDKSSYLAPALLETLGIRHTGCSATSILLTTDKVATKAMLRHLGIPTPEWVEAVDQRRFVPRDTYIVKALYEDASIGLDSESVRSFRDFGELKRLLEKMKAESGREFFAERFIDGREFGISILGENGKPRVLTPSELRFPGYDERNMAKVLDYDAKWEPTSFGYQNIFSVYRFAHEDSALLREMQAISEKCWSFFGLSGYARIDFRVDKEGRPWVLEINANPCITPGESGFLKSAEESGFDFGDVIDRIISEAWSHDLPRSLSRGRGVV